MGSKRRSTRESRCPKCQINTMWCFCDQIKVAKNITTVDIIMHFSETHLTSNTASLAKRSLEKCNIHIRGKEDQKMEDLFSFEKDKVPLFLYPDENAVILDKSFLDKIKSPIQLIVPDGTWRQAKKVFRREKIFSSVQTVKIPLKEKSIYTLRKQKIEEGLCTIEAIAKALGQIEDNDIEKTLMDNLKVMNNSFSCARKGIRP